VSALEGLLLFRSVEEGERRARAARLLAGVAGERHPWGRVDLWELSEAAYTFETEPVAVAATSPGGSHVTLLSFVVVPAWRGQGLGQRVVEDVADAIRARGALLLSAEVPAGNAAALAVLRRAGFREPAPAGISGPPTGYSVVCLDLEL
jgi:ribosomal protein S18 acetylase RimI-like enzyme